MTGPRLQLHGRPTLTAPAASPIVLERKDAAWLAVLAIDGASPRDMLAAWLWPGVAQKTANTSLRQRVFRLRRRLGHELVSSANTLALLADVVQVDGAAQAELLAGLEYGDCPAFDDWLRARRERHRRELREALAEKAEREEREGQLAAAIATAERLVEEDRLSEHAHRRLMRLHHRRGDRAAAIQAFERLESWLHDELGARPGDETLELLALVERAVPAQASYRAVVPAGLARPPRMVGRNAELAQLSHAWAAGRIFLVLGEAGMGKTRLLQEFASSHASSLLVAARPGDAAVPYALLARLLTALGEQGLLMTELAAVGSSGRGRQLALQQAVEARLSAGPGTGLRVLLDDLHFADDASLDMLLALVNADSAQACQWGLAQRPGEGGGAATALRLALEDTQRLQQVPLLPLDAAAMRQLVQDLGIAELDADLLGPMLHAHTGGNPLFALETLKDLVLGGSGGGSGVSAAGLPQPATVGLLLDRRISRLSPLASSLLRVAALAGGDFSAGLAAEVLATPTITLSDAWRELEQANVFADGVFAHDLVAEAARRSVPAAIARDTHGAIASHLERTGAPAARVAEHWTTAERASLAAPAWDRAARQAAALGRHGEQCRFLEQAACAWDAAGDVPAAFAARASLVAPLASQQGPEAALLLAQRLLGEARSPAQRLQVLPAYANALLWNGRFAEAEAAAAEVLTAGDLVPEGKLLESVVVAARSMASAGRGQEAAALLDQWHARADAMPLDAAKLLYFGNVAPVLVMANRRVDAIEATRRHLVLARAAGRVDEVREALSSLSVTCLALGQLPAAIDAARELHLLERDLDDGLAERWVHDATLGWCLMAAGRLGEALATLETALARHLALMPDSPFTRNTECFLADTFLALAQPSRALRLLGEDDFEQAPGFIRARRLWTRARALRMSRRPPGDLLERALAVASGDAGLPMRLLVRLERSLDLEPQAAVDECTSIMTEARVAQAPATEVLAQLRCMQAHLRGHRAADAARIAVTLRPAIDTVAGPAIYRPEVLLACALAHEAVADHAAAREALAQAQREVRQMWHEHVPAAFRDSFEHRHPVHVALQALSARISPG